MFFCEDCDEVLADLILRKINDEKFVDWDFFGSNF